MQNPIYTEVTSCRDCYKCVRSCPVKAIQIKDGHAMIIKDRCLYCGRCVHVCPNNAKKIRSDVDRVKLAIQSGRRVICSLAPSYASEFGGREAPLEGASTSHKGVDIGAATGTPIKAAASGTVVISTYSASAGNYIMINHGGGVYTVYMHMGSLGASVGDEVSQGDTIGTCGSTGNSTGPHLHFGIRINGSYVDPLGYVSP